ncbi:MAG: hypothetical protein JNK82_09660 [Myxococcaceae bacterium]|nr:hypothetical protein [Myxococcaceae bacterium]
MHTLILLSLLGANHTSFKELPSRGGGPVTQRWMNGEPMFWLDRTPGSSGELFGFGWSDKLYLFKSGDSGATWSYVDPTAGESIGGIMFMGAAQDAAGKVHLLFVENGGGSVRYSRVALEHTGGAITGFRSEVKNVALPGSYNTTNDVRGYVLPVMTQGGDEVLLFGVTDNPFSAGNTFRLQMGKSASLAPMATADFTQLDGGAGATVVFTTGTFNNHDHSHLFTQLPASRDIWVFWGPVDAEYGVPDPTFMTRLRISVSGASTWSVGTPITGVGSDATSSPELLGISTTQSAVWMFYLNPTKGLSIDRVAADGTYTTDALPSPDPTAHRNGWGALSVAEDGQRAWAVWNTMTGPGGSPRTAQAVLNAGTWTTFADQAPFLGDSWGFSSSWNWREGVVAGRMNGSTYAVALASAFGTGPSGSGGGSGSTAGGSGGTAGGSGGTAGGSGGTAGGSSGTAGGSGGTAGGSGSAGAGQEPAGKPCGCHTGGPALGMLVLAVLRRRRC